MDCTASLWRQIRISRETGIGAESLVEPRLHDSLPVGGAQARVAKCAPRDSQRVRRARARDHARSEIRIVVGAYACAEGQPRERLPANIKKSRLIVTARVKSDIADESVFHLVLITGGNPESFAQECRLPSESGTIVLIESVAERAADIQFAKVKLRPVQLVMPMRATGELGMK